MVVIFLGSKKDIGHGKEIGKNLDIFGVEYKIHIASAHKTPEYLLSLIKWHEKNEKFLVYICAAGRSNALGGFVDAHTRHPVINCPPYCEKYAGLDIISSLRMPSGIASLTVLEPEQAALAASKIMAHKNTKLANKILSYQKKFKENIIKDDQLINH